MNANNAPLSDELLTSWFARRSHVYRGSAPPVPVPILDRRGIWRHPDIRPTHNWLKAVAERYAVPTSRLAEAAIARQYPFLPLELLSWEYCPFDFDHQGLRPRPKLHVCWCSRCLAEDFAAGRPAYIRGHWVLAITGFCHVHRWPLEDQCVECGSPRWRFTAPARGPLRLFCDACWRPLERALPAVLRAGSDIRECWDRVIAFEAQVLASTKGRLPDQFRFNFTSASQLLTEVTEICRLLMRHRWSNGMSHIPLNSLNCSAMTPGRARPDYLSSNSPYPLAVAGVGLRRGLLAAAAAIIDPSCEMGGVLFGKGDPPAIDTFVALAQENKLDRCLTPAGHWSPTLVRQIESARQRKRASSLTEALRPHLKPDGRPQATVASALGR